MKKITRKCYGVMLAIIMLLSAIPFAGIAAMAAEPADQMVVSNTSLQIYLDGGSEIYDGNGFIMADGSIAICAERNKPSPSDGTLLTLDRTLGESYVDGDIGVVSTEWAFLCFYYSHQLAQNSTISTSEQWRSFATNAAIRRAFDGKTASVDDPNAINAVNITQQIIAAAEADADGLSGTIRLENGVAIGVHNGIASRMAYYSSGNAATQKILVFTTNIPYSGYVQLMKTSANPSITDGNSCYSLAGAEYGVYTDLSYTNQVGTLTTDEWGNSNILEVNAGIYHIKEITAPLGFALDDNVYTVTVTAGQTATISVQDIPQNDPIAILLQKVDASTGLSIAQGNTSLEGAEFTVKYFSGFYNTNPEDQGILATRTWVLKTDQNGIAMLSEHFKVAGDMFYNNSNGMITLPLGTTTIQETKAPEGYLINPEIFIRQITSAGTVEGVSTYNAPIVPETAIHGGVHFQKRDLETTGNTPQGGATLAGTVIAITNTSVNPVMVEGTLYNPGQVVKTVTTGADGTATVAADVLPYGSYSYTEVTPPTGYLSEGILSGTFDIVENGVIVDLTAANTSIQNNVIRGGVRLQKRDYETTFNLPQGNATLGGAVFEIINISANPVLVEGTLYNPGQVVKTVTTGLDGSVTVAANVLPYGSYRVNELTAPNGYLQEGITSRTFDIRENGVIVDLTGVNTSILNQIKRGDLELIKIEDGTNYRMANIPFRITSKTTGENHVIVTDINGYASTSASWNSHLQNTNRGQTDQDGVWFGELTAITDSKGALPYDTYILDELLCAHNEGKHLLTGIEITISRDNYTVNLGTLTNDSIPQEQIVRTTAKDAATGGHNGEAAETVTIIDTVEYANLKTDKEYTLKGILMDKATGSPLLVDGQEITAETTFIPTTANGTVDVSFTFHGSALWGKEVVVFESLYRDGIEIYTHADINDQGQTVTFPEQPKIPVEPETPPATPKTGDHPWITPIFTGVFFVSAGCIFGIAVYRKKKQHE